MARRRITKARITHVSLVPKGANKLPVLYKDDGALDLALLTKTAESFQEKGEVIGVVYAPEVEDSQGDVASHEVIREAMHEFAKSGEGIDIRHDGKTLTKGQAFVAESFEIQKADTRFAGLKSYDGKEVDPAGGWGVVIKIDDADLREKYRTGQWAGLSMGGTGEVTVLKENDEISVVGKLIDFLKSWNPGHKAAPESEIEMTDAELKKMLEENNVALTKALAEVLKPVEAPATPATPAVTTTSVAKEETLTESQKLRKELIELRKAAILEEIDHDDPESMEAAIEKIEALEKPVKKTKVTKSAQARETASKDDDGFGGNLKIAKEMSDFANEQYGHAVAK